MTADPVRKSRHLLSWIFAMPLFGYAGIASYFAETHLPNLLQMGRLENVAFPPMTVALLSLGSPLATLIALALPVALVCANVLIPYRWLNILSSLALIMTSVLFTTFLYLAVWFPEQKLDYLLRHP